MLPADDPSATWIADDRLATDNVGAVVDVIITEFGDQLHDATIIEHVVLACQQLFAAGVMTGIGPATEALARARLWAVATQGGAG